VADNGIAIGAGTDVAIDAADIVVMKSRLTDVTAAIRLSRETIRNIHQNLFWAFFYNAVCIPLAMGLYGIEMKPMYGAAAMALSSFFVCMNALRLNLVKPHDTGHDKKGHEYGLGPRQSGLHGHDGKGAADGDKSQCQRDAQPHPLEKGSFQNRHRRFRESMQILYHRRAEKAILFKKNGKVC
jgi:hypothetical protein